MPENVCDRLRVGDDANSVAVGGGRVGKMGGKRVGDGVAENDFVADAVEVVAVGDMKKYQTRESKP